MPERYAINSPIYLLKIQSFNQIKLQTRATSAEDVTEMLSLYWALILLF